MELYRGAGAVLRRSDQLTPRKGRPLVPPSGSCPPLAINYAGAGKNSLSGGPDLRLIWPWQDRNRRFSWLKAGAFALGFLPAVRVGFQFCTGEYGILSIALGGLSDLWGGWATGGLLSALPLT